MKRLHRGEVQEGISAEQSAEISLVPLVDLCLTLVVVFLIMLPMSMTSLLPITAAGAGGEESTAPAAKELPLLVNIDVDTIRVGAVSLRSDLENAAWFRDAFGSRHNHELIVVTASDVPQDRLVHWLDTIRNTGQWSVTLAVNKEAKP